MTALLSAIVIWLAVNFDLPAHHQHPAIAFAPASEISELRYPDVELARRREVLAIYDDASRTIVLPHGWNAGKPRDLSILVHEMVHHLQNVAGRGWRCPAARERLAYAAQERWLGLFGRDLRTEFGIDPMTLKLSTSCLS